MPDLEQSIREHAYHLWIAEGRPHGRCDTFWLNAERQMLAERVATTPAASAPAAKKSAAKKSLGAKKKRAA